MFTKSILFLFLTIFFISCASKKIGTEKEVYIQDTEKIIILEEHEAGAVKNIQNEVKTEEDGDGDGDGEIIELKEEELKIINEILEENKEEKIACYSVVKSNALKNIVKKFLYDKCYVSRSDDRTRCNKTNIFIQEVMSIEENCACIRGKVCKEIDMAEQYILDKYILKVGTDKKHKKIFTRNLRIYDYKVR